MGKLAKWTPFVRGTLPEITLKEIQGAMTAFKLTEAEARAGLDEVGMDEIWLNSRYQVNVRRDSKSCIWLSIKRIDKQPPGPERFRDFQRIKNELVGAENEAVELYPAESRMVDTANQYHLWVAADPTFRFPIGFKTGRTIATESLGGARQMAFEE